MSYPTDPYTLANLAEWEWQELLARVAACSPLGRRKIIHVPQSLNKQYGTSDVAAERRATVRRLKAEGWKNAAIARKLAVDPSLITRILKNER
jgi:DNA invertase Pin-like site-specific DNA recombinase